MEPRVLRPSRTPRSLAFRVGSVAELPPGDLKFVPWGVVKSVGGICRLPKDVWELLSSHVALWPL